MNPDKPTEQPSESPTFTESPAPVPPAPEMPGKRPNRLPVLIGIVVVIVVIAAAIVFALVGHKSNTSGSNDASSAGGGHTITGLRVPASAVKQYTRTAMSASDLQKAKQQQAAQGIADFYRLEGGVDYFAKSSQDLIDAHWGTVGPAWSFDDYITKGEDYLKQNTSSSVSSALTPDGSVQVAASNGKRYTLQCLDLISTDISAQPPTSTQVYGCLGPLGDTKAYLGLVGSSSTNSLAASKTLLKSFVRNVTVQLR